MVRKKNKISFDATLSRTNREKACNESLLWFEKKIIYFLLQVFFETFPTWEYNTVSSLFFPSYYILLLGPLCTCVYPFAFHVSLPVRLLPRLWQRITSKAVESIIMMWKKNLATGEKKKGGTHTNIIYLTECDVWNHVSKWFVTTRSELSRIIA